MPASPNITGRTVLPKELPKLQKERLTNDVR